MPTFEVLCNELLQGNVNESLDIRARGLRE